MTDFIKEIARRVETYPSALFNSVRIAQAIQETGYGQSELAKRANNYFGIKASPPWTGETYSVYSPEEVNGKRVMRESTFRKYKDMDESVKDHAGFITSTPYRKEYYASVINATTPEEQARALSGTYATDSRYGDALIKHINQHNLKQYDTKGDGNMNKAQAFQKLGLKYTKEHLPLTKTFGRVNRKEGIVIHQSGAPSPAWDARRMADYQRSMSSQKNHEQKSWNYQVDDKQVIESFDHDVATWQSSDGRGPGNMAHISIEGCINQGADYAKSIDNMAKTMAVIAYVEKFKDIESSTKRHYDFAPDKKWCPAQIMNGKEGFTYSKVKQMAQGYLNTLRATTSDFNLPEYTKPKTNFKVLKVGDTVTIRDPHNYWYIPETNQGRKPSKDFTGTTDEIVQVLDVAVGYSKRAYLLKGYRSWILEQDVVEARPKPPAKEPQEEQVDYVFINGVKRVIGDEL